MPASSLSREDLMKVRTVAEFIEKDLKYHTNIPELAERFLINQDKLKKGFKYLFGVGPYSFLQEKRIMRAKLLLLNGHAIRSTAITVGFSGHNAETNFIKSFKKYVGKSPAAWKREYINTINWGQGQVAS